MNLPLTVPDVDTAWLARVLAPTQVTRSVITGVMGGTADKLFIEITTHGQPAMPRTVCLKGGFNPETRAHVASGYIAEARFFGNLASELEPNVPRCWWAGADPEAKQGIVILEDLTAAGASYGDPVAGFSVDEVARGLETQAAWHASTWHEAGLETHSWLGHTSPLVSDYFAMCLSPEVWKSGIDRISDEVVPAALRDPEVVRRAVNATASYNTRGPRCLTHGDAHIGNTFIRPDGGVGFLDWQTVSRNHWADDVAYFMVGALTIEDRRRRASDLLSHYVDEMVSRGVPRSDLGAVEEHVRRQHTHGLFWAVLPEAYQPLERCIPMAARYAAAAIDDDTFGALGV